MSSQDKKPALMMDSSSSRAKQTSKGPSGEGGASGGRMVLGRGLNSLIPVKEGERAAGENFSLPLEKIEFSPVQPRVEFDESRLEELATSIRESGILQPVVVRPEGEVFIVVAGERRTRAARLAGLERIPVVVKDVSPEDAYELALVENVQREDLGPLEEAEAYRRLMEDRNYTQEQLARRIGKDRTTVANSMRLLKLPAELKEMVVAGKLTAGHARALLGIGEDDGQIQAGRRVVQEGLSVRATEDLVRQHRMRLQMEEEREQSLHEPEPGSGDGVSGAEPDAGATSGGRTGAGRRNGVGVELPELPPLPPIPRGADVFAGGDDCLTGMASSHDLEQMDMGTMGQLVARRWGITVDVVPDGGSGRDGGEIRLGCTTRSSLHRLLAALARF